MESGSLVLGMRVTTVGFQDLRESPWFGTQRAATEISSRIVSQASRKNRVVKPSGPGAFDGLRSKSALQTSSLVKGAPSLAFIS